MTDPTTEYDPKKQLTLTQIIPPCRDRIKQSQALDAKWKLLQQIEVLLLAVTEFPWPAPQHDRVFSCLGSIRQLMTDVQCERETGWPANTNGRIVSTRNDTYEQLSLPSEINRNPQDE